MWPGLFFIIVSSCLLINSENQLFFSLAHLPDCFIDAEEWSSFPGRIFDFLKQDLITLTIDGKRVTGFRSPDSQCLWIRDHQEMMKGGRYLLEDIASAVTCFAEAQTASGRIFDNVTTVPETRTGERENWEKWIRVPVEADVEYRFASAVWLAWQTSGDHAWMQEMLPRVEKALSYMMSHPWRWDDKHKLVKRAYTIDTWDFDYTAGRAPWLNFDITENTFWGIFHGDNSGLFEASLLLSRMYKYAGLDSQSRKWEQIAAGLRERANKLLFNGRFYTHFHKLTPVSIEGVDESEQLSLSNPMAINRGLATHEMAVAIIREYQRRRREGTAFAEWFSIDPPFPSGIFGDEKLVEGAYINGGIFPLAGGELALAAFEHGFEEYGIQILRQYKEMIEKTGETYLWYFPDGRPSTVETSTSPDALPTDGWGSSSMLCAFTEGLCGVRDMSHSFRDVWLAPRWFAAGQNEAKVTLGYPASSVRFGYEFMYNEKEGRIRLLISAEHSRVHLHLLLPSGKQISSSKVNEKQISAESVMVQESRYAEADFSVEGRAEVLIYLQ